MKINLDIIGHMETPYLKLNDCPRNIDMNGPVCRLVLQDKFKDGIKSIINNAVQQLFGYQGKRDRSIKRSLYISIINNKLLFDTVKV